MRMDKLTTKFQMALAEAQSLAVGRDHQFIEPAHLLVALLDQEGGTVRHLLTKAGVKVDRLRSQLGDQLDRMPRVEGAAGEVHISGDLSRLLNVTDKLAQKRGDQYITSEPFVLAALEDEPLEVAADGTTKGCQYANCCFEIDTYSQFSVVRILLCRWVQTVFALTCIP